MQLTRIALTIASFGNLLSLPVNADQAVACGVIGTAGCQRLTNLLTGADTLAPYYDIDSAKGCGWKYGGDGRATWCGDPKYVNDLHEVTCVQRGSPIPISHEVDCTQCDICKNGAPNKVETEVDGEGIRLREKNWIA